MGGAEAGGRVTAGGFRRRTTSGVLASLVTFAVNTPLSVLAGALVARSLGPAGQGSLASYQFILALLLVIGDLGVGGVLLQRAIAARVEGREAAKLTALQVSLGQRLALQSPVAAGGLVVVVAMRGDLWVVVLILLAVPLQQLALQPGIYFNAQNDLSVLALANIVGSALSSAVVVTVAVMTRNAELTFATRVAASAVILLLVLAGVRSFPVAALRPKVDLRAMWAERSVAGPLWVATVLGVVVYSRSEVVFLDFSGLAVAAGVFAVAFGLTQQVTAPIDALSGLLLVSISEVRSADSERGLRFGLLASRVNGAVLGVVMCGAPALSWAVLFLYGTSFAGAAALILPLLVASCAQSLVHPLQSTALASFRTRGLLLTNLGGAVMDLVLLVLLVPILGAMGAALANMAAQMVSVLLLVWFSLVGDGCARRAYLGCYRSWFVAAAATTALWGGAQLVTPAAQTGFVASAVLVVGCLVIWIGLLRVLPASSATAEEIPLPSVVPRWAGGIVQHVAR